MKQEFSRPLGTEDRRIEMPVMNRSILFPPARENVASNLQYRVRMLSSQLLTAQEDERKRIAREIHDGLGQMLAAIKFKIEINHSQNKDGPIEIEKLLNTLLPMIQECIEETRRVQMDLRPPMLDDLGILATINWFTREFACTYPTIQIKQNIEIEEDEVPLSVKTVIFRVMQEAFNNISKHSRANLICLSLRRIERRIELAITDDGIGFNPGMTLPVNGMRKGYGLTSMRERVELSGGAFRVESFVGLGTTIQIGWPLQDEH
ncbi:MAG: sensor histidine kinase [Deltaproteobacteria bacterium]|nr:sensor histidine kinase [Deltaproteobacteria bacterium]